MTNTSRMLKEHVIAHLLRDLYLYVIANSEKWKIAISMKAIRFYVVEASILDLIPLIMLANAGLSLSFSKRILSLSVSVHSSS